jgi:hypothetical protein
MYSCCCVIIVETRSNCTQHAPSCYRHGLQHLCEILEYIYTAAAVDIIRVNEKKILYIERVDTSNSTSIGLCILHCIRDRKHLMCEIVCEEDKGRATF